MKTGRFILALLLMMTLFAGTLPVSAVTTITMTAVNDQFLALSDSTMPTRKNGDIYVPYTVFTGTLGIHSTYDSKQQILTLSQNGVSLTFLLAQSYVYDQNMKSYSSPAYMINQNVYVPVKLVCTRFGLSFSIISNDVPIVRICNDNVVLSDTSFATSATSTIQHMLDVYNGKTTSSTPSNPTGQPSAPGNSTTTPSIIKPSLVYLTFFGAPSALTNDILDVLSDYNRVATFFLPVAQEWDGSTLRRIAGEGHSFGLYISGEDDNILAEVARSNKVLFDETGCTARIISSSSGTSLLSAQNRDLLSGAGYRFWDPTLNSQDITKSSTQSAKIVTAAFSKTSSPCVVRFGNEKSTASALQKVMQYIRANAISTSAISIIRVPINTANDLR